MGVDNGHLLNAVNGIFGDQVTGGLSHNPLWSHLSQVFELWILDFGILSLGFSFGGFRINSSMARRSQGQWQRPNKIGERSTIKC